MHKVTTAVSYGISASSFLAGLLDRYTQEQWNKAAMLFGIVLGVATFFLNWYYRRKTLRQLRDIGLDEALASKINRYLGK
ncbi:phage holin [Escherichia coli]|uniref:phage holin n=1 Tax=Escherichia coli TaxID=562 RepID=UPI001918EAA5|nr:phage holin [Escherichia coli]CAD6036919.1 lysis S family protein [Escherichia coli]CAD6099057.1 lysis S family protein [Escherichia coli]CAD6176366.1 lysis S family protein [Escherichia coli]